MNASNVYFSVGLNTFLCGVKQTVHFIRKANNLAREYQHLRGTKLGFKTLCRGKRAWHFNARQQLWEITSKAFLAFLGILHTFTGN